MIKLSITLLAACSLLAGQSVVDAAGVSVQMNGASVLHRASVPYPSAALQKGVQGAVSVEVKINSTGDVSDAQVLSGPDELRKAVLESVLQWHFTQGYAGTTRVVQVGFELPKVGPVTVTPSMMMAPPPPPPPLPPQPSAALTQGVRAAMPSRIGSVKVEGLAEPSAKELLARLPLHEGDEWTPENMQKLSEAAKAFDEHLSVRLSTMVTATGERALAVVITAPGSPQRIKVGGNVQAAMVLKKVAPVYPAAAKAAGVSGVVHMAVIIGKDGTITSLSVIDGPTELIQAATDAVKQWVYRPTMLNGDPVDVETTVDINFTLNQ